MHVKLNNDTEEEKTLYLKKLDLSQNYLVNLA